MKEEEHAAAMGAYKREEESDADSKKLYSGNGYNNGTLTVGQIKELQAYYGVEADGLYGPKTQAATGGLPADEAYANIFGGTSETKKLTASEIKGVSSEVAARVADGGINAAEGYLDVMVSSGLLTEEEAKMILAPYVTVDEDETVDTTVPNTSTGVNNNTGSNTNTGSNPLSLPTSGNNYPTLVSPEEAGAFANAALTPEGLMNVWKEKTQQIGLTPAELMKLWKEKGQWTGLTPEEWVKTLK